MARHLGDSWRLRSPSFFRLAKIFSLLMEGVDFMNGKRVLITALIGYLVAGPGGLVLGAVIGYVLMKEDD